MGSCSILLVDDDRHATEILRHLLAKAGFTGAFSAVQDAEEALRFLDESIAGRSVPALIIVDLSMPAMHGLDLVREIRRRLCKQPCFIAVVSGSINAADVDGAFTVGADAYLEKFPTVEDLARVHAAVVRGVRLPGSMCMLRSPRDGSDRSR